MSSLHDEVAQLLRQVPIDFGGGCSVSKATVMAYLVESERIDASIDIGIYRGRSYFPQALAHRRKGRGTVYGVDPYTKSDAMEFDHNEIRDQITAFVEDTDFDGLYVMVDEQRRAFGLAEHCEIIRTTSDDAVQQLTGRKYGLIHIDGNHDTGMVIADVEHYLPLLDPGNGFLVMDDISWSSVKPAVDLVSARLALLYARVDTFNDYAVFWTGSSRRKKSSLRKRIALVGEG